MSLASPFEVARSTHEESERYSAALASVLGTLPSSSASSSSTPVSRTTLTNSHLASLLVDRIVSRNRNLLDFYADETGARKQEQVALSSGQTNGSATTTTTTGDTGDATLDLFYSRLSHIKSYHEKYPAAPPETFTLDLPALENSIAPGQSGNVSLHPMDRLFSGEEGIGRYLDLYEYHSLYINLKGINRITYLKYLEQFHIFNDQSTGLDWQAKRTDSYAKYLNSLKAYLIGYLRKIQPLDDIDELVQDIEVDFETQWGSGTVEGWADRGQAFASSSSNAAEKNGPSIAVAPKQEQQRPPPGEDGLWCDACQKTFSKQTVFDGHLSGNKHKKAVERQQASMNGGATASTSSGSSAAQVSPALLKKAEQVAKNESVISALASGPLNTHRLDTHTNVERRAALTEKERAAEAEQLAAYAEMDPSERRRRPDEDKESDSDSDDNKVYNPKKLPLGWDGRPIPLWLWKLHGLGQEFTCEICSDAAYAGRKNFDRHFTESRHAFGMRALGLPNTKHFHGITKIQDAVALGEKLKKKGREEALLTNSAGAGGGSASGGGRDVVEEVEDENGNTYSRRDYELLKRQGLI